MCCCLRIAAQLDIFTSGMPSRVHNTHTLSVCPSVPIFRMSFQFTISFPKMQPKVMSIVKNFPPRKQVGTVILSANHQPVFTPVYPNE